MFSNTIGRRKGASQRGTPKSRVVACVDTPGVALSTTVLFAQYAKLRVARQSLSFAVAGLLALAGAIPCSMIEHAGAHAHESTGASESPAVHPHHHDRPSAPGTGGAHDHGSSGREACCHDSFLGAGIAQVGAKVLVAPTEAPSTLAQSVFELAAYSVDLQSRRFLFRTHPPRFASVPIFLSVASLLI